jgi:hypothetical protein
MADPVAKACKAEKAPKNLKAASLSCDGGVGTPMGCTHAPKALPEGRIAT